MNNVVSILEILNRLLTIVIISLGDIICIRAYQHFPPPAGRSIFSSIVSEEFQDMTAALVFFELFEGIMCFILRSEKTQRYLVFLSRKVI